MGFPERYLDFMLCVLWADGVVTDDEISAFQQMLDVMGIAGDTADGCMQRLKPEAEFSVADALESVATGSTMVELTTIVRDAFVMAGADGVVHQSELEVIQRLVHEAGVAESKWPQILEWGMDHLAHLRRGAELFK